VERLEAEVAELRGDLVAAGAAQERIDEDMIAIFAGIRRLVMAAPLVAGHPASSAEQVLYAQIIELLTDLSADAAPAEAATPPPQPKRRSMPRSAAELAAAKTNLMAERAELRNALRAGERIKISDLVFSLADRLTSCKSSLLAMPGRLAHSVAAATTQAEVGALIGAEIEAICAALTTPPIVRTLQ
jgi:hypothetical protein